jgi:serine/threonine protein kinase
MVGERYMLGRQEGHGGFSICYRAWDNVNQEMVAIKELFPWEVAERLDNGTVWIASQHRVDFDIAVHSLCHEGEVLRKLTKEPGIVHVGDVFQDNDTAYLPMEFLRGRPYEEYLQNLYAREDAYIGSEAAVNVALMILGALDAVHARGLLHLDVKPANIRVLDDGRVVLLDFGSARDAFRQGNGPYGDTFTPGFAAPEQHHPAGSVTAATDVYGLAATLYYSLSLTVPTRADEREAGAVLTALSEVNRDLSPGLDPIIQKAMALDPQERYRSVKLLRQALEPFATVPVPLAAAPVPRRIVAGLLDIVVVMLLLAALTAGLALAPEQVILAGVGLWLIAQLVPILTTATPGMWAMGLRLTGPSGGAVAPKTLLLRPLMLLATFATFQFRPDSERLLMHDRATHSRVVATEMRATVVPGH